MNGIAGVIYPDIFQMDGLTTPMLETMKHRGRGGEPTIYAYRNIEMGLCSGSLATNEKKNIYLAIDGEITNHHYLHQELHKLGYNFKMGNQYETAIRAYEHWGTDVFQHLAGPFAIAILDQKKKYILLAKCRIGKQPLYWYQGQNHFLFASELKALISTGAVPQTPALDAMASYLYFGYVPQDMAPIQGVSKLLPSHYLQYNFDGSIIIEPYWSYSSYYQKPTPRGILQVVNDLDGIITKSIKANLPNEEKVGCLISGGLGSASVAAYLSKLLSPESLDSFTVAFHGETDEDMKTANAVTQHLGLTHQSYSITKETFLNDFVKIVWHLDEPLADPMVAATWKLAEMASQRVSTAFSGMGSDELFAGHNRYTLEEIGRYPFQTAIRLPFNLMRRALIPLFTWLYKPFAYQMAKHSRSYSRQFDYLEQNALFNENEMLAASEKLGNIFDPEIFLHRFYHLNRLHSDVSSFLYFDVKTRLVDCYINQYEKLTAAHSLNWKAPLLDYHLFEYMASIPEPEFLHESETAIYLKAIAETMLPPSVVRRPKRTRKYLLKDWITGSYFRELFILLTTGTLVESGLISRSWLKEKINTLETSSSSFRYLWAILQLEIWFRLFIMSPAATRPPDLTVRGLLSQRF